MVHVYWIQWPINAQCTSWKLLIMFTDGSFTIFVIVGKTDFFQIFHDYQSKEEYLNMFGKY